MKPLRRAVDPARQRDERAGQLTPRLARHPFPDRRDSEADRRTVGPHNSASLFLRAAEIALAAAVTTVAAYTLIILAIVTGLL